jgi:cytochrome b
MPADPSQPPAPPPKLIDVRVWDLPTRLFHWSLASAVVVAWITGSNGAWGVHFVAGLVVLALVIFRLLWGVLGSDSIRFATFVRGPRAAIGHVWETLRGRPDHDTTHNAVGGWAVVLMLALLSVQVTAGLFADVDDGLNNGPLMFYAPDAVVRLATRIHAQNAWIILAVVSLHVFAVLAYWLVAGRDLIQPMVTGVKQLPAHIAAPRMRSAWIALALFLLCAAAVRGIAALG